MADQTKASMTSWDLAFPLAVFKLFQIDLRLTRIGFKMWIIYCPFRIVLQFF